jgi:hypothetical protein
MMPKMNRLLIAMICCAFGRAQESPPLVHHTFESGVSGWATFNGATVKTIEEEGRHRLSYEYDLDSNRQTFLGFETKHGLAGMARIRFRVKADYTTTLFVGITEPKPAPGRQRFVSVRGGQWEQIDLNLSDFVAGSNPLDPLSPAEPPDLDRVQGIAIADVARGRFTPAGSFGEIFGPSAASGKHTLLLADFQVLRDAAPVLRDTSAVSIDRFDRGSLHWLLLGNASFELKKSNPLNEPAVEVVASPTQTVQAVGLLCEISNLNLDGTAGIELDLASEVGGAVFASIEVRTLDAARDNRNAPMKILPGGRSPTHFRLPYQIFAGKGISVIPSAIRMVTIALVTPTMQQNIFWIGNVRAYRDEAGLK